MFAFTSSRTKVFTILFVLACICYANVLNGPLILDDEHFIQRNPLIHSLKNIPQFFSASARPDSNFYRPLQMLVNSLVYRFFKLNPIPYHAVSILLHLANAFLLFTLLAQLSFSSRSAFLASAIFLIHPVQTQAVSAIAALSGPLGTFFLLPGIIQFSKSLLTENRGRQAALLVLSAFLYIMALLCREDMVICLPLSMIVAAFIYSAHNTKMNKHLVSSLSLFGVIVAVYLFLKFTVLNFSTVPGLTTEKNIYTQNLHIRLITFVNILWDYAKLILFPLHLSYEKPYMAFTNFLSLRALFGVVFIGSFAFASFSVKKHKRLFLGLGWFFASLLPYTGIIPLNAMYLEHWLYVPLIGILILLAALLEHFENSRTEEILLIILIPVCLIFAGRTIARNAQWSDIEKFYLNELRYTGSSARVYNNLGMYYADKKDYNKAALFYKKAIQTWDNFPQSHHNLANIYLESGQTEQALGEFHSALRINPNFIYSLERLYVIYSHLNQKEKAQKAYEAVINLQKGGKNTLQDIEALFY